MDFRKDINGLRAIAVLIVVLYHYGVPSFDGGYVGVDVFFVISGYLMTQTIVEKLDAQRFSLVDFYWARARRIVPALFVLLLVLLIVGGFRILPLAYAELAKTAAASIAFVSNVLFWRQRGYFDTPEENSWLLHTWSLAVEWQFYLLYPLILLVLKRWADGKLLRTGIGALALLSLALSLLCTPWKPEASFFLLPTRAWEMLAGGLVYLYREKLRVSSLAAVGIALILVSTVVYDKYLLYPGYYAIVPVLGSALVLAGQSQTVVLTNRVAQFLGDTSYSIYLWHWPLIVGARALHLTLDARARAFLIILALASAWLSFRGVEQLFRRVRGRDSRTYALRCAAACSALFVVCLSIFYSRGLPQRVPALAAKNDLQANEGRYAEDCRFVDGICTIGPDTPEHVLVWGDSHAEQLYPALVALSDEKRPRAAQTLMATSEGCLPIRGLDHAGTRGACEAFNQRTFARAQASDIHRVILVAFWEPYFREKICRVAGAGCVPFGSEAEALAFAREGLRADLASLVERGKSVTLVLPVPTYPFNVSNYLAERSWFGGPVELSLTRNAHEREVSGVASMFRSFAAMPGLRLIDPADVFCASGNCQFEHDGISLYRDGNHLTTSASLMLLPLLEHELSMREL